MNEPKKISLDEYLGLFGLASPVDDFMIDKMVIPRGLTQRQRKALHKENLKSSEDYHNRRNEAIKEYYDKLNKGEIIEPTFIEKTIKTASGHPDNPSVQAARRILHKRGYIQNEKGEWENSRKEKVIMNIEELLNHDMKFRYQMLDRLRTDCDYYLSNGNRQKKHLWANDEVKQIEYMKELWKSFPEEEKPEWLTYEQICEYEKAFQLKLIKEERNEQGQVTYEKWSDGSWKKYKYDEQGRTIYSEDSKGTWEKREYNSYGHQTYYENNIGYWFKQEYDEKGNLISMENSEGNWDKRKYDEEGNLIYQENSTGLKYGTPTEIEQNIEEGLEEPDI